MRKMVSKCEKVLNILRCLTGCSSEADRNLMLMIDKARIRAIFDYGCVGNGSVAKSTLAKLADPGAAGGNGEALYVCSCSHFKFNINS